VTSQTTRRALLTAVGTGLLGVATVPVLPAATASASTLRHRHQAGITTRAQPHLRFLVFDVVATSRTDLARLLDAWTHLAAHLTNRHRVHRLTITFGVGPTLFVRHGRVRFALAVRRPAALEPLPKFTGDAFEPARSGGDVMLQVCADDPDVVHAVAVALRRAAAGRAHLRSVQAGTRPSGSLPRNQFGFHEGNGNLDVADAAALNQHVWLTERSGWMHRGTYLVVRRIRMDLEQWAAETVPQQEAAVGRFKDSGAPLSGGGPRAPIDLSAVDATGQPLEPPNSHVAVAHPDRNDGVQLLRRSYQYDDGVTRFGRRDTGLLFCAFTNDPGAKFVPMQQRLIKHDTLQRYLVGTSSALFAVPPATAPGQTWANQVLGS
jgi:deferrochelatase/peroxidase EfeB